MCHEAGFQYMRDTSDRLLLFKQLPIEFVCRVPQPFGLCPCGYKLNRLNVPGRICDRGVQAERPQQYRSDSPVIDLKTPEHE
jgi:hypothetical protein